MKKIEFSKLQASGNDFILLDARKKLKGLKYRELAKKYCQRKLGVGADGLLVIEPSRKAMFKMRIFNADGSEAEMCGNGARCVALWASSLHKKKKIKFDTVAGVIEAGVSKNNVKIKLTDPFDLKMDFPLTVLGRKIRVNYINSGVPHAIVFVEGLDKIDIEKIGRALRFHKKFQPAGTNVNFVEVLAKDSIVLRTYERGVEAETLACGTGSVACAIISLVKQQGLPVKKKTSYKARVLTRSGETLKVYFDIANNTISNVWLEGKAYLVYKGELA